MITDRLRPARPSPHGRHEPVVLLAGVGREYPRLDRVLRGSGFGVRTTSDGPTTVAQVLRDPPAAVVLAWLMRGLGGAGVCTTLRHDPRLRRLPIVLLAARGDGDQIAEGFRAGADEVLTRPLDSTALVGLLRRRLAPPGRAGSAGG